MGNRSLVPLIILVVVVGIVAFVGYVAYSIAQDVSKTTREKMEKKHMVFSRDGMKIGVKEIDAERENDRTQSVLVNIWNHTSFPAYKSRLWNMAGSPEDSSVEKRKPYSK